MSNIAIGNVIQDTAGNLVCIEHKDSSWCKDLEKAVRSGDDARILWEGEDNLSQVIDDELNVPVVPSRGQWACCVVLRDADTPKDCVKVYLKLESVQSYNDIESELVFLGFLHRGEGRGVLRSMLLDLLQSLIPLQRLRCDNSMHSYAAQMEWERATETGTQDSLAEYWSVYNTGKCITCSKSSFDDFSDLIPDPGGKKWR